MALKMASSTEQLRSIPSLLTTSEVAELLHVHPNTVRKWHRKGLITAYRVGPRRDRRFERENVKQVINMYDIVGTLDTVGRL